jgi:RNA polymerase sigma factor (sigma-70 family)
VTHAAALRPETRLAPWLFTVARNLYASYCRARLVETSHAASHIGLWPTPAMPSSPFEALAASETERRLEAALATLPIAYREALLLVTSDDLSASDAAAVCGISPEAMRQRVSRGRAMLARRLKSADTPAVAQLREAKT